MEVIRYKRSTGLSRLIGPQNDEQGITLDQLVIRITYESRLFNLHPRNIQANERFVRKLQTES